jgi:1,4-alpha-glucan branching enzyme
MILNSDAPEFGGFNRVDATKIHHTFPEGYAGRRNHLCAYIPSRTCFAFAKVEN